MTLEEKLITARCPKCGSANLSVDPLNSSEFVCLDCDCNLPSETKKKSISLLSEEERIILSNLIDDFCVYIARDRSGELYLYNLKPEKSEKFGMWVNDDSDYVVLHNFNAFSHLFKFITWGDEEPWSIKDLLAYKG